MLSVNRPRARNSVTKNTCLEIAAALNEVAHDPSISVLLFRGEGRDFCCGADLKLDPDTAHGVLSAPEMRIHEATAVLHEMRAVTVAAIKGGCAGAGLGWACACDFRVADETAIFNTAFLSVGLAGDMATPWSLPRIVGAARARELSFFPGKVTADEALRFGLITRLWRAHEFEGELDSFVGALLARSADALRALKSNYVEAEKLSLRSYIEIEAERHIRLHNTSASVVAFEAKRK